MIFSSQLQEQRPTATLYRMVMDKHICPYGLKARYLLHQKGYRIDDRALSSRQETDRFKDEYSVSTTPQVFIDGERIGGYDALRRYFGKSAEDADDKNYWPVIALFSLTALMALAVSYAAFNEPLTIKTAEWFIAFSMVALSLLKLQDIEQFSTMFLNYDLLAKRWVAYAFIYPFAEGVAGLLMISGTLSVLSVPLALFIGSIGAISVYNAVYIEKRTLRCACVGGSSTVPLGFLSLTENLMMVGMALWMGLKGFY